jgi:hypothetical protein
VPRQRGMRLGGVELLGHDAGGGGIEAESRAFRPAVTRRS